MCRRSTDSAVSMPPSSAMSCTPITTAVQLQIGSRTLYWHFGRCCALASLGPTTARRRVDIYRRKLVYRLLWQQSAALKQQRLAEPDIKDGPEPHLADVIVDGNMSER